MRGGRIVYFWTFRRDTVPTEASPNMTNPHVCAHCENSAKSVTDGNGFTFSYRATRDVEIEMFLHDGCAEAWALAFGVENPSTKQTETVAAAGAGSAEATI